jgi:hypothetical protein
MTTAFLFIKDLIFLLGQPRCITAMEENNIEITILTTTATPKNVRIEILRRFDYIAITTGTHLHTNRI